MPVALRTTTRHQAVVLLHDGPVTVVPSIHSATALESLKANCCSADPPEECKAAIVCHAPVAPRRTRAAHVPWVEVPIPPTEQGRVSPLANVLATGQPSSSARSLPMRRCST